VRQYEVWARFEVLTVVLLKIQVVCVDLKGNVKCEVRNKCL